jgi:hypothetical protein
MKLSLQTSLVAHLLLLVILSPVEGFSQVRADDITADFESGNITDVTDQGPNDIYMRIRLDDGHGDLYGWFYFKVKEHALNQTVTFHITNPEGWVNSDYKPLYSYERLAWNRVSYATKSGGALIFRHTFTQDSVCIAFCFPYTITDLDRFLDSLAESPYLTRDTVGQSAHGRDIELVTLTDFDLPVSGKKTAWIISRQHPMETGATFLIENLISSLIDTTETARTLRSRIVWKINPIVNVDGVYEGYSRHNVNGVNLNRNWDYNGNYQNEEPSVAAVHRAMDEWISQGNSVDFFLDMHCAPDYTDFGFKLALGYVPFPYWSNQKSFLVFLERYDPYQNASLWRDIDESYGSGLAKMAMYNQHGLDALSSENPWLKRENGSYVTIASYRSQGLPTAQAIYKYLFCVEFTDTVGSLVETYPWEEPVYLTVEDPDENHSTYSRDEVEATVTNSASADTETVILRETDDDTGIFRNLAGLLLRKGSPCNNDGVIQTSPGAVLCCLYQDDDFLKDWSSDSALVGEASLVEATESGGIPRSVTLFEGCPNPFNSSSALTYELTSGGRVSLKIYNLLGQELATLVDGTQSGGPHTITWNGDGYPTGVYFSRLQFKGESRALKLLLLR